jgi:molecular chaperone DnaK
MLKDFGDKVAEGDKTIVEAAMADLKTAMQGEDADLIKQKVDALTQASMKLGEAMYQAHQSAQGAAGDGGPSETGGPPDNVVDVDFEEVKDDDSKKSA